jgi:hypothetical protein
MATQMGQKVSYGDGAPQFMVTRGGDADLDYETGGDGFQLGKRYESEASGITVLCTKPGPGRLSVAGEPLTLMAQKKLPSSD